jgi:hypothetical protein
LRWLGAIKGELAIEQRLQNLIEAPLLVLDDLDRAVRSYPSSAPLSFRESCASQDLIRLAGLLRDRQAAMQPTIITTRANPVDCASQTAAVTRMDLVRGLLVTVSGNASPFEDFPAYSLTLLESAMRDTREACSTYELDADQPAAIAEAA